jgi:hypothetical protein
MGSLLRLHCDLLDAKSEAFVGVIYLPLRAG